MPSPHVTTVVRPQGLGRGDGARSTSLRSLCVLACLGTCLLVSVANLFLHVARRAAGIEDVPRDAASYSGGVLSDPSDQIISLEQQIGIVQQPRGDNLTAADVAGVLPQLLEQAALGQSGALWGAPGPIKRSETAICLLGRAGDLEATGPSILRHLVAAYQPADLFVHSPLDESSAKLWVLSKSGAGEWGAVRVAGVRVFPSSEVEESKYPRGMLGGAGSANGVQGVLQYLRLVEGCLAMLSKFERQTGEGEYRWVVTARLNAFWSAPPPPLLGLQRNKYIIPFGNDNGGLNDRFGVGSRKPSAVALRRLSLLAPIFKATKHRNLTPERAFLLQFRMRKVRVARRHFSFCTLTRRLPTQAQGQCSPAVASLGSSIPLDGTDCMPCDACTTRPPKAVLEALFQNMALKRERGRYPQGNSIQVCNLTGAWEEGRWEQRFDEAAGAELAQERQRTLDAVKDRNTCIRSLSLLRVRAVEWDAPPPWALCSRSLLGPAIPVGEGAGIFRTLTAVLSPSRTWDVGLQGMLGVKIVNWGEGDFNSSDIALGALSTDTIHALKFMADGSDLPLLDLFLTKWKGKEIPVCQLLVAFPKKAKGPMPLVGLDAKGSRGVKVVQAYAAYLQSGGLHLDSCIGGQKGTVERCTFYSLSRCTVGEH